MGVMFALGGSLMVESLDRSASRAVRNRARRLVLLSPLLRLYRRWNLPTVLLPLSGLLLLTAYPDTFGTTAGWVVQNVLAFGSCWVLGFAHREGDLALAVWLFDPLKLWRIPTQGLESAVDFSIALAALAVAVLAPGWVEDVAARRSPRLSPFVRRPEPQQSPDPADAPAPVSA